MDSTAQGPASDTRRIPNFNTLSTLIDRLTIENVKLAHFQHVVDHEDISPEQATAFKQKIALEIDMIDVLKQELARFLEDAFITGDYSYFKEERTFK